MEHVLNLSLGLSKIFNLVGSVAVSVVCSKNRGWEGGTAPEVSVTHGVRRMDDVPRGPSGWLPTIRHPHSPGFLCLYVVTVAVFRC